MTLEPFHLSITMNCVNTMLNYIMAENLNDIVSRVRALQLYCRTMKGFDSISGNAYFTLLAKHTKLSIIPQILWHAHLHSWFYHSGMFRQNQICSQTNQHIFFLACKGTSNSRYSTDGTLIPSNYLQLIIESSGTTTVDHITSPLPSSPLPTITQNFNLFVSLHQAFANIRWRYPFLNLSVVKITLYYFQPLLVWGNWQYPHIHPPFPNFSDTSASWIYSFFSYILRINKSSHYQAGSFHTCFFSDPNTMLSHSIFQTGSFTPISKRSSGSLKSNDCEQWGNKCKTSVTCGSGGGRAGKERRVNESFKRIPKAV